MQEAQEKNKNIEIPPIDIFVCYAREDEEYCQRLEKHLSHFQREDLIRIWHDRNISLGQEREQAIHVQLNMAHIVLLLLVSPDFMASEYCYSVEMKQVLERQIQREVRVVPVIVRSIGWKKTPLGKLQALPRNARPIALWRNRDAAFFDVEDGIRQIIEEIRAHSSLSAYKSASDKESFLAKESFSDALVTEKGHQKESSSLSSLDKSSIFPLSAPAKSVSLSSWMRIVQLHNKKPLKRMFLIFVVLFLIFATCLISFPSLPTCVFTYCHLPSQTTKQSVPQEGEETPNHALSAAFRALECPSFVLPGNPSNYSDGYPPQNICAVLIPQNAASYCTIIVEVQDFQFGGVDIRITAVALKLQPLQITPQPLNIWTPGVSTTYDTYPYHVTYRGQSPDQLQNHLLYATPEQNVILQPATRNLPGERDQLSLQIMSTVTVDLQFDIQISYVIADASTVYTKILPQTFHVIFSDRSNWHEYVLQDNGSFAPKL